MQNCTTSKANVKAHKQQKEEHARRQKLNYKEDHTEASQRNRLRREKCCRGWEAHSAYWISPTKHGERPSKYYAAAEPGSRQAYPQNRIRMQQCDDTKAKEAM